MEHLISPKEYEPRDDHLRVACAVPETVVGDIEANVAAIADLYEQACTADVSLVVFPELCLTSYSIQDLVRQPQLLDDALTALQQLAEQTADKNTAAIVGLPVRVGNALYNTAAVVASGHIQGIVPKQNLPTYGEFYEKRWFQTWDNRENVPVSIGTESVPFGRRQLFVIAGQPVGIEICEDLWVGNQPSIELTAQGATIIANPSASPESVAKAPYRTGLIGHTAARLMTGYVYTSADSSESTADVVMSGYSVVSEMGHTLAERPTLSLTAPRLTLADIDTQHIQTERTRDTNYPNKFDFARIDTGITAQQTTHIGEIDAHPFSPKGSTAERAERLDTILDIQAFGLARRLSDMPRQRLVMGLSGGLDSTLALLVAVRASEHLHLSPRDVIQTLTLPGEASSMRTQSNAVLLAQSLGIDNQEIAIGELAAAQLAAIGHDGTQDVTYENTQARIRTDLLFNIANQQNALALGTGDESEIALGWCTYGGDQLSGYNPNASIPKTLVRDLVAHAAAQLPDESHSIVLDILDTPVSPELVGDGAAVSQKTEDIIGPYELHDFFLWHLVRWMEPERKIGYMALQAFGDRYSETEIYHWLDTFMVRFYANQWKRQASPDGAKVGMSLSPRGDWRMSPESARAAHDRRESARRALERSGVLQ